MDWKKIHKKRKRKAEKEYRLMNPIPRTWSTEPKLFKTPEALAERFEEYFDTTPQEEWTVTGMCLAIGTNKMTINSYEKREGFKEVVKWAKAMVEWSYELGLRKNGKAGDIFALKNFGWRDDHKYEITGSGGGAVDNKITIEVVDTQQKITTSTQDALGEEDESP